MIRKSASVESAFTRRPANWPIGRIEARLAKPRKAKINLGAIVFVLDCIRGTDHVQGGFRGLVRVFDLGQRVWVFGFVVDDAFPGLTVCSSEWMAGGLSGRRDGRIVDSFMSSVGNYIWAGS